MDYSSHNYGPAGSSVLVSLNSSVLLRTPRGYPMVFRLSNLVSPRKFQSELRTPVEAQGSSIR